MIRPGRGGFTITDCDVCGNVVGPGRSPWMRVRHEFVRRDVCAPCQDALTPRASDRGASSVDAARVMELGSVLGGEIWRIGDVVYWFEDPLTFRQRPTPHSAAPPHHPSPEGSTSGSRWSRGLAWFRKVGSVASGRTRAPAAAWPETYV